MTFNKFNKNQKLSRHSTNTGFSLHNCYPFCFIQFTCPDSTGKVWWQNSAANGPREDKAWSKTVTVQVRNEYTAYNIRLMLDEMLQPSY